jgi:hypothetical protein
MSPRVVRQKGSFDLEFDHIKPYRHFLEKTYEREIRLLRPDFGGFPATLSE